MKAKELGFEFDNRDILAITEAVVGISQSNYATLDDKYGYKNKMPSNHIGVIYPIQ